MAPSFLPLLSGLNESDNRLLKHPPFVPQDHLRAFAADEILDANAAANHLVPGLLHATTSAIPNRTAYRAFAASISRKASALTPTRIPLALTLLMR